MWAAQKASDSFNKYNRKFNKQLPCCSGQSQDCSYSDISFLDTTIDIKKWHPASQHIHKNLQTIKLPLIKRMQ